MNHIEFLLILIPTITECVSISLFPSLICIPIWITSSAIGLKICVITARLKTYISIIKKKKKKHYKMLSLAKSKLNSVKVWIKNIEVVRTNNGRMMLLSKCAVYNSKKTKYRKEQEARGLLSKLTGVKILILCDLPILNTLI